MPPLISVVIPVYNGADFAAAAISSALAQTYRPTEVIVVDDGSTDAMASHRRLSRRSLHWPSQSWTSAARNAGIRAAQGGIFEFLTPTMLILKSSPSKSPSLSPVPSRASFCEHAFVLREKHQELSMFEKYNFTAAFFGHEGLVVDAPSKLVRANFIPTSSVIARKRILIDAGGFDENFRKAEDWDLWLRIALRSSIAYTPDLLMLKRVHDRQHFARCGGNE